MNFYKNIENKSAASNSMREEQGINMQGQLYAGRTGKKSVGINCAQEEQGIKVQGAMLRRKNRG
jgi:hypothetical protein